MAINIGNNNKIKEAIIGSGNIINKEEHKITKVIVELLITIIGGLIVAFCIFIFHWN